MGGGTSKPTPRGNRAATERTDDDRTGDVATPTNAANPALPKKLACTVTDSKTNTSVAFSSSIKADDSVEIEKKDPSIKSPNSPGTAHARFGDVAIGTSVASSQKTNRAVVAAPRSTWHDAIHEVVAAGVVEPPALTRASIYGSCVAYASPMNYNLRSCGGQPTSIRAISCSSDGAQFASACQGGKIASYFDTTTGRVITEIKGHTEGIVSLCLSRDGKFLLTASSDCTVVLWDLNNAKRLREVPISSHINAVAVNEESDMIATCTSEDVVNLWEARSCDPLIMFQRHAGNVLCVAFSRRGGLAASGDVQGDLYVWTCITGEVRFHLSSHNRAPVCAVCFSHDAQRLCSLERDIMHVWDLFTGQSVFARDASGRVALKNAEGSINAASEFTPSTPRFTCASFIAGNLIMVATNTKQLLILNPNTGEEVLSIDVRAYVTCISPTWNADVVFFGDSVGNHFRLQLFFRSRDVVDFAMTSKPPSKEKGGRPDRD